MDLSSAQEIRAAEFYNPVDAIRKLAPRFA